MKIYEMLLWILGTTLLAVYFGNRYWGEHQRREGLEAFAEVSQLAPQESSMRIPQALEVIPARVARATTAPAAERGADAEPADGVIAVLRVPALELEVPVYQGTTEHVLRRGAGLVEGTAFPGTAGNVGIAAHRDTHFRGLKDVAIGDLIELGIPGQVQVYRIISLEVVEPADVHVLDDTGEPMLTLVTCYPFYFVGNAPQRFIVRASPAHAFM